jgi:WD40 repeat protein
VPTTPRERPGTSIGPYKLLEQIGEGGFGVVYMAEQCRHAKTRRAESRDLKRLLLGDLDWIVMKALEKDRRRRYDTANSLRLDVRRFLDCEPVTAAAPSIAYRFGKFSRRNRDALVTAGFVAAVLLLATIVSTWQAIRATQASAKTRVETNRALDAEKEALEQRERAVSAEIEARGAQARAEASEWQAKRNEYISDMATANREFGALNTMFAIALLNKHIPGPGEPDFRGFEWRWLWNQCHQELFQLRRHTALLRDMRFSPDGKLLATGATDGTIRLWNIEAQQEVWRFQGGEYCNSAVFSPDGKSLVTSFFRPISDKPGGKVLWNLSMPESPVESGRFDGPSGRQSFSIDGRTLWTGGRQFDLSGKLLRDLHPSGAKGQDFSKDGKTSAWLDRHGNAHILDVPSGKSLRLPKHEGYYDFPVKGVAISPIDADVIVTGSISGARIWNRSGDLVRELPGTSGTPLSMIRFSKDGDLLAVRKFTGAIEIFETKSWTQVGVVRTPQPGNTVAFSPADNTLLLAGGDDGVIRAWRVTPNEPVDQTLDHPQEVLCLEFSPKGDVLAAGLYDGSVRSWDLQSSEELFTTPPNRKVFALYGIANMLDFIAFAPDSNFAAIIGPETTFSVWDLDRRVEVHSETLPGTDQFYSILFSNDGARLYAGAREGSIGVFEWNSREPRLTTLSEHLVTWNRHLAASPDGLYLATQSVATTLLNMKENRPVRTLPNSENALNLAFSPDGSHLAGCTEGGAPCGTWPPVKPSEISLTCRRSDTFHGCQMAADWPLRISRERQSFGTCRRVKSLPLFPEKLARSHPTEASSRSDLMTSSPPARKRFVVSRCITPRRSWRSMNAER